MSFAWAWSQFSANLLNRRWIHLPGLSAPCPLFSTSMAILILNIDNSRLLSDQDYIPPRY